MIRFIDLRGQVDDIEDYPVHFAYFDTVTSSFIRLNQSEEWNSRVEFAEDYRLQYGDDPKLAPVSRPLARFVSLMPGWVP